MVRGELESHHVYKDLRLIIIGDEISRNPEVRRAVVQTRTQQVVRFLGFVPFETLKEFYSRRQRVCISIALRRFRTASTRSHGDRNSGGYVRRSARCRRSSATRR